MKKLLVLVVALVATFGLTACGSDEILENESKAYYATGQFNGWSAQDDFEMEAIKLSDERVASIKSDLKGVESLYILEITLPTDEAGWTVTYTIDSKEVVVDGYLTVKIIKTDAADKDSVDFWAQSPESGKVKNLTPDTLYIPPFVEENVDDAGTWNDNPIAFEAGTYYIVFAEKGAGTTAERFLGLVPKA